MMCPVCSHLDNNVFTCAQGHQWHWNDETGVVTVRMPPTQEMITISVAQAETRP